jgi:hypothetical protein
MAKHVILEQYTFTPATKTIVVTGKNIRREQLLLITNTNTGTVLYNFSDPSLGISAYTNAVDATTGQETTTIVLVYNTAAMSSTDKLSILVEETYTEMVPAETYRDPVDKLRVSTPQSLIDTDFEYGLQPTKWESINMLNNRPTAFYDATVPLTITNVTASGTTVTVTSTANPGVGVPVFIQGTLDAAYADGWWITTASSGTNFSFNTTTAPAASLYDATKTYVYAGSFFSGSAIPAATNAFTFSGTTITVTTTNAHGLRPGNGIMVKGLTATTNPPNGNWVVATVPTSNTFTYTAAATPTGTITATLNASLYPRALGYTEHRPYDGGVQFSNETPYHGYQVIRQTRRYFRYQSGKGVQFSTGSILKPPFYIDNVTSSGTTVTVTTKYPHGVLPGAVVYVNGANETDYNGTFTVVTAPTPLTFTYTALATPTAATATGNINSGPNSWYGSSNRIGMFDFQNGFYFEFDGQQLYAVKRSSTFQLAGKIAVTNGSNTVTGTNTKFSSQLLPGDWIVIRGQSYIVQAITSDTQLFINPEYRGTTATNCIASKTINTRYPQSSWNIDRCDGTGASGFNADLTKMQMFYADYTWYGAGAIRFGFKNNRGEVIFAHRIPNNNVNTEAYMRSGNLPARYETNTVPIYNYLTATLSSGVTSSMSVASTANFPSSGTVMVTQAGNTGAVVELISYTGKTATTLTGLTRNVTGGTASATTFTYSATAPIDVELYSPQAASTISHWGSSVIMDGRYDDDKSFLFNYGMNSPITYATAGTRYPVFSIRLAPSVDNGITGLLGAREIINRMQLTPVSVGVFTTTAAVRVELWLNARVSGGTFAAVGGSSLAQACLHANTQTISGGEPIFTFIVAASTVAAQDLSKVRDLGTSILGGGTSLSYPTTNNDKYPDGPDILTVAVIPLGANAAVAARLNWTEAQA